MNTQQNSNQGKRLEDQEKFYFKQTFRIENEKNARNILSEFLHNLQRLLLFFM